MAKEVKKRKKKTTKTAKNPLRWIYIAAAAIAMVLVGGIASWLYVSQGYDGEKEAWVYIPENSTKMAVRDSLVNTLGESYGYKVYKIWDLFNGTPKRAYGAYRVEPGMKAYTIARNVKNGIESPVKVTFNNARTIDDVAGKIAKKMPWTASDFINACDSILPAKGYNAEQYQAAFIPDSYDAYWSKGADEVVKSMLHFRDKFWTTERKAKAKKLGLSEIEVTTIASIVEEETIKKDERPLVARLYLNRVHKKMKLQADPTVKFALQDFTLRRILHRHLEVESPYNTYKVEGLPPGPIRFVEGSTIDAVLNAPAHDYIYMCAKEDFSGYHNFAKDFATHDANAKRYQKALNERGIKK